MGKKIKTPYLFQMIASICTYAVIAFQSENSLREKV